MGADEFDYAKDRIWDLPRDISNEDKLELYKFYKQAVFGDCNVGRPGGIDLKGQAKWDAWASIRGMSGDEARDRYVRKAKDLFASQGESFY